MILKSCFRMCLEHVQGPYNTIPMIVWNLFWILFEFCLRGVQKLAKQHVQNLQKHMNHLELVQELSRSSLGIVYNLSRNCLELSRNCLELAQTLSRTCPGIVQTLSRKCLELITVMSRTCLGFDQNLYRNCLELVQELSRTCLGIVQKLSGNCLALV